MTGQPAHARLAFLMELHAQSGKPEKVARTFLFMNERDFRRKFKELQDRAKEEGERPTTLHLMIHENLVCGQIRSNERVLFTHPANFNPKCYKAIEETFKEAKQGFGRRITHNPFETNRRTFEEYGYIV